jgi:hypothetical protein
MSNELSEAITSRPLLTIILLLLYEKDWLKSNYGRLQANPTYKTAPQSGAFQISVKINVSHMYDAEANSGDVVHVQALSAA